jgi:hypothetical protein
VSVGGTMTENVQTSVGHYPQFSYINPFLQLPATRKAIHVGSLPFGQVSLTYSSTILELLGH